MFHLPHFLHLGFLGLGEKHRPYTLEARGGESILLKQDGETESDEEILAALDRYLETKGQPLVDGSYNLDYDVEEKEFHGLGTTHEKYRVSRTGEYYTLFDENGKEVDDEDDPALIALTAIMDGMTEEQFNAIPEDKEGLQLDFNADAGTFRGFGGGDSGGAGASDDYEEKADEGGKDGSDNGADDQDDDPGNDQNQDENKDKPQDEGGDQGKDGQTETPGDQSGSTEDTGRAAEAEPVTTDAVDNVQDSTQTATQEYTAPASVEMSQPVEVADYSSPAVDSNIGSTDINN